MAFINVPQSKRHLLTDEQRKELGDQIDGRDNPRYNDVIQRSENKPVEKPTRKGKSNG